DDAVRLGADPDLDCVSLGHRPRSYTLCPLVSQVGAGSLGGAANPARQRDEGEGRPHRVDVKTNEPGRRVVVERLIQPRDHAEASAVGSSVVEGPVAEVEPARDGRATRAPGLPLRARADDEVERADRCNELTEDRGS